MLSDIKEPSELKKLNYDELYAYADELRARIIDVASRNGGHLASNLGMIHATIALHRVFDSPKDKIVFDVGHQCYAHKLITGRNGDFDTLRRYGGISGFTSPSESEHDMFYAGHCGASLSAALGVAEAARMSGSDAYTVAVIGDAAFSNGMIFEAMNNCIDKDLKLVILLNDNEMSISKSVGGLSGHLSNLRISGSYFALKHSLRGFLGHIPFVGDRIVALMRRGKDRIRRAILGDSIFECMGLDYLGPVDGHDIKKLESVLEEAKTKKCISVVHMMTEKGKGYLPAETAPERYHSVGAFDPGIGMAEEASETFSTVFGDIMCERAAADKSLCAITAAMCSGTGLDRFIGEYGDRFFDVGIEEEHAVAFAGGLGKSGMLPVFAVYSTFLQRSYDQIFHDVAIQSSPVIFSIDRAGLVGGDGITHQGIFDCAFLSTIPGMEIYSPDSFEEMRRIFSDLFDKRVMAAVRYPKGGELIYDRSRFVPIGEESSAIGFSADYVPVSGRDADTAPDLTVITYGRLTAYAAQAAQALSDNGYRIRLIRLSKVYPIDFDKLIPFVRESGALYFLEEGIKSGGIAEKLAAGLFCRLSAENGKVPRTEIHAIDDRFVMHGDIESLFRESEFTAGQLRERFERFIEADGSAK